MPKYAFGPRVFGEKSIFSLDALAERRHNLTQQQAAATQRFASMALFPKAA